MSNDVSIALATQLLFLTSALVGSLAIYLSTGPSQKEWVFTLAVALVLAAVLGVGDAGYAGVMVFLCYWAVVSMVCSAVVPFAAPHQLSTRRRTMLRMLVPPAGIYAVELGLRLNQVLTPHTFDYYLYAADASWGYQFGFLAGQVVKRHDWLREVSQFAYINLPLAATLTYLAAERRSAVDARRFLYLVMGLGAAGWLSYLAVPGAGSVVVFGSLFPDFPPDLSAMGILQAPRVTEPRNCIPSLHAAWGLALCWYAPRPAIVRAGLVFYLVPMLFYTLACGHYLVDLVAAVPFALAVDAATRRARLVSLVSGAIFIGWLLAIRFATQAMLITPAVPWAMTALTLGACWRLRARLRTSQTTQLRPAALAW